MQKGYKPLFVTLALHFKCISTAELITITTKE